MDCDCNDCLELDNRDLILDLKNAIELDKALMWFRENSSLFDDTMHEVHDVLVWVGYDSFMASYIADNIKRLTNPDNCTKNNELLGIKDDRS